MLVQFLTIFCFTTDPGIFEQNFHHCEIGGDCKIFVSNSANNDYNA